MCDAAAKKEVAEGAGRKKSRGHDTLGAQRAHCLRAHARGHDDYAAPPVEANYGVCSVLLIRGRGDEFFAVCVRGGLFRKVFQSSVI